MPRLIKRWATRVLTPIARGIYTFKIPAQRLWAHACLAAQIKTPLDSSVVVHGCAEIQGSGQITLGRDLCLYRELYLETQEQGQIILGDHVVLSRGVHVVSFARVELGTGTMIGEYSSIRDVNHGITHQGLSRYADYIKSPVTIGKNVWIGRGVAVLAGVTIGDHSVIGANAVVTKDIPAHSVAVGIPARVIKQLD